MEYLTLLPDHTEAQEWHTGKTASLYEVCQQLVDGRAARGKRTIWQGCC